MLEEHKRGTLITGIIFYKKGRNKPTMKERVRSGIPLSLTQASITPWISAHTVVPRYDV